MQTTRPILVPVLKHEGVEVGTGLAVAEDTALASVDIEVEVDGLVLEGEFVVGGVVELVLVVDVEVAA
jgi:hypothetical protein